jgi:hypothetical protein
MTEATDALENQKIAPAPLVFISHDTRDGDLAEAFSKLLKSVSAGMLKSFRSSDKKGTEGIEFGDEWYKALMLKLDAASDVVCLLTERSLERPWLLYEAGVAKGKLNTPVHGLALGVPLGRVSTGPFYQFQNSDDSEESLTKLTLQLCRRVSGIEPDSDVVKAQVQVFKATTTAILNNIGVAQVSEQKETLEEGAVAKVLEEMKLLIREFPLLLEQRIMAGPERLRRRTRRIHPMMIEQMTDMLPRSSADPIGILIIASTVRDDFPWLYELAIEAYRAAKTGSPDDAHETLRTFRDVLEFTLRGPFVEELGPMSKDLHVAIRELPKLVDRYIHRTLGNWEKERARMVPVDDLPAASA